MSASPTLRNTASAWGMVSMAFHWLLALLIVGQFALGWVAEEMRLSPRKFDLFVWHKSIGVTILSLVVLRLLWRLLNPPPAAAAGTSPWERRAAMAGHALLYLLMFAVPLSGWWVSDTSRIPFKLYWTIAVPDLMEANGEASKLAAGVHEFLTTLLMLVVAGHVLAALRHHFLLRDETLSRMLGLRRPGGR